MFREGEIVAVNIGLGLQHYGITTGYGTVISASKRTGSVVEESAANFSAGRPIVGIGYPSNVAPYIVINNARRSIGKKWNLVDYNCQHFATECHERKHSPQLQQGVFALGLFGAMLFITRGKLV
jgi:hypothetical protein